MPFIFDEPDVNGPNREGDARPGNPMRLTYPTIGRCEACACCGLVTTCYTIALGIAPWAQRSNQHAAGLGSADEFLLCRTDIERVLALIEGGPVYGALREAM